MAVTKLELSSFAKRYFGIMGCKIPFCKKRASEGEVQTAYEATQPTGRLPRPRRHHYRGRGLSAGSGGSLPAARGRRRPTPAATAGFRARGGEQPVRYWPGLDYGIGSQAGP